MVNTAAIQGQILSIFMGERCDDTWSGPFLGVCYRLSKVSRSWLDAVDACRGLLRHARLASITKSNKDLLAQQDVLHKTTFYWVGLRSGQTHWNQGTDYPEVVDYTNWQDVRSIEPNGNAANNDDCVVMTGNNAPSYFPQAGSWLDWPCSYLYKVFCEYKPPPNGTCRDYWPMYNGVCYFLYKTRRMSFNDANAYCALVQPGATLAAVTDYDALNEILHLDVDFMWIGLHSTKDANDQRHWLNGDLVNDTHWQNLEYSEPNADVTGDDTDCVYVNGEQAGYLATEGKWGDYRCSYPMKALCAVDSHMQQLSPDIVIPPPFG